MDASFNGLESEAERERERETTWGREMQRKERGGTNGIHRQPIVFKPKQFKRAFYNDKICSASEAILTVHGVT